MTFFEAAEGEAIRPMLDVTWAPLLGALSVLFEEQDDEYFIGLCLEGFVRWERGGDPSSGCGCCAVGVEGGGGGGGG